MENDAAEQISFIGTVLTHHQWCDVDRQNTEEEGFALPKHFCGVSEVNVESGCQELVSA